MDVPKEVPFLLIDKLAFLQVFGILLLLVEDVVEAFLIFGFLLSYLLEFAFDIDVSNNSSLLQLPRQLHRHHIHPVNKHQKVEQFHAQNGYRDPVNVEPLLGLNVVLPHRFVRVVPSFNRAGVVHHIDTQSYGHTDSKQI